MSIPNHILEQLNSQADLVGIIGKHTTLKRAGKEFKGNCPFHGEKHLLLCQSTKNHLPLLWL